MTINYLSDYSQRTPLIGHFELTHKCSFKCEFCYNHIKKSQELSTDDVLNIIDQVVELGCFYINFSGGEPLLRKDFNDIYLYTKKKGVHVSLESNMYYIPRGFVDLITEYPLDEFNISIYGVDDRNFKKITGSNNNYRQVLDNLEILLKQGIMFKLRTPISKGVLPILVDLKIYADSLGVPYKADPKIFWKQDGTRLDHLRIYPKDVLPYLHKHNIYENLYNYLIKNITINGASRCRWGINEFYINPYGELHYCNVYWSTVFSLKNQSFKEIWYDAIGKMRKLEGDYCIGKVAGGRGGECPSGYFYSDVTIDTTTKMSDRIKNIQRDCGVEYNEVINIIDGNL